MIRAMSHSIAARWRAFWFAPAPVTNLAIARLLFFLGLTVFYLPHDFSGWGDVSPALYQPVWLFDYFGLPVLSVHALNVIQAVWKLSLLCACIGFYTRTSITLAAIPRDPTLHAPFYRCSSRPPNCDPAKSHKSEGPIKNQASPVP